MKISALLLFFWSFSPAIASIQLSPDYVVERMLSQNLDIQRLKLEAEKSKLALGQSEAVLDWKLRAGGNYTSDETENLSGISNSKTQTTIFNTGVQKKIKYGTSFSLAFARTKQESVLSAFTTSLGISPVQYQDVLSLGIRQELLRNGLGQNDRKNLEIAQLGITNSELRSKEQIEQFILEGLALYWRAYVASVAKVESALAKEKYAQLLNIIERKLPLGLADRADLERVRAEYAQQNKNLEVAKLDLIKFRQELGLTLRMDLTEDSLEFHKNPLPKVIEDFEQPDFQNNRIIKALDLELKSSQLALKASRNNSLPSVDLVAQADLVGTDANTSNAWEELSDAAKAQYKIGIEFVWLIDSHLNRADMAYKNVVRDISLTKLEQENIRVRDKWILMQSKVKSYFEIAKSSKAIAEHRSKSVRSLERKFRQGRIGSSQLVIDYNAYFLSRIQASRDMANYFLARNEMLAFTDKLIGN